MACFRVPKTGRLYYFLFNPRTWRLIECDENGKPIAGQIWVNTTVQAFVKIRWHGKVSAASQVWVFGERLSEISGDGCLNYSCSCAHLTD
jgi:hypothetical protein